MSGLVIECSDPVFAVTSTNVLNRMATLSKTAGSMYSQEFQPKLRIFRGLASVRAADPESASES